MAGPTRTTKILTVQRKDAFAWAAEGGTTGVWDNDDWLDLSSEDQVAPFEGFTVMITGRKHTKFRNTSPPELWERLRSYASFYTSGFRDSGYVESVKLKMYVQTGIGAVWDPQGGPTPSTLSDWAFSIFTVSGGYHALHKTYELGFNPAKYGFGDQVAHFDAFESKDVINYDVWGLSDWPSGSSGGTLERHVASGIFSELASQDGITALARSTDGNRDIISFRGWVEIPLPIDMLNLEGETHFRFGNISEITGLAPQTGPGGVWNHHEYLSVESEEAGNSLVLEVNYTAPASYPVGNLRRTDLSLQRHLQIGLESDPLYSGVDVLDGFPTDPYVRFDKSRNISLEHVSSKTNPLEVGTRTSIDSRRFFIDLVCDRRGELLDLEEKVQGLLHGSVPMYDFSYGFINPPEAGQIAFQNLRVFDVGPLPGPDRTRFHKTVSVDTIYLRSGS